MSDEIRNIIGQFKKDYKSDPFVKQGNEFLVKSDFLIYVVGRYLEKQKSDIKAIEDIKKVFKVEGEKKIVSDIGALL